MISLSQVYKKYLLGLLLSVVITALFSIVTTSPQAIKDLFKGYGGGDQIVLVLLGTLVFFIGLIIIFALFILKTKMRLHDKLRVITVFVLTLSGMQVVAGIVWANLGGIAGIICVLGAILLTPKLTYLITNK